MSASHHPEQTAIRTDLVAIFVSLELSRATWLITSLSPGRQKMAKHQVRGGDIAGLLACLAELQAKARARTGQLFPLIVIQEAGLDGFWIHRVLQGEGIESHVVDPASIATARRRRRAKTDKIDGEALIRALLAYKRGEPRVCAMVKAPTPREEDERRIGRERKVLTAERVAHINRIKGLLFAQGISDYEPMHRHRRARLDDLTTGDGRPLPAHLKAQISRELDRLELLLEQLKAVDAERDALLAATERPDKPASAALLLGLKGVGPEFANVLWSEGLCRSYANRRQVAAYAGLAPTPWQSGAVAREQGVSKAGNPRLRTAMIQLAWLWLRHQPGSALSRWFHGRVARRGGLRKTMIVALARKLLVALWRYVTAGVVIQGATMKR
jgi:transposase